MSTASVKADGRTVYRTSASRALPKWQSNRGVTVERFLTADENDIPGFDHREIAVAQLVGEPSQFMIPVALLGPVN